MGLIAQTISFQYQNNDTWMQPALLHYLPFSKTNIHRSVAHSTCGIPSRALMVLLSASEHSLTWGLSRAQSSMCALCLLTQTDLSGANPAFAEHTVSFSLCWQQSWRLRWKFQILPVASCFHLHMTLKSLWLPVFFFFLIHKMGKLSPYNIFAVRLNETTTAVFKGIWSYIRAK